MIPTNKSYPLCLTDCHSGLAFNAEGLCGRKTSCVIFIVGVGVSQTMVCVKEEILTLVISSHSGLFFKKGFVLIICQNLRYLPRTFDFLTIYIDVVHRCRDQ